VPLIMVMLARYEVQDARREVYDHARKLQHAGRRMEPPAHPGYGWLFARRLGSLLLLCMPASLFSGLQLQHFTTSGGTQLLGTQADGLLAGLTMKFLTRVTASMDTDVLYSRRLNSSLTRYTRPCRHQAAPAWCRQEPGQRTQCANMMPAN
jgi:hypothetical protein